MPVVRARPHERPGQHNWRQTAMGAARLGHRVGENAWKAGKEGWKLGRETLSAAQEEAEAQRRTTLAQSDESIRPPSAEEQLETMRERKLEKLIDREFPEEVAQELGELLEEAKKRGLDGHSTHKALGNFFSQRYPQANKQNLAKWIKIILRTTHPDYAATLKE